MEEETRRFLLLILNTISIALIWMMANVLIGIYMGFAFFEGRPTWKNICYYAGFLISLFFITRYLLRKWRL